MKTTGTAQLNQISQKFIQIYNTLLLEKELFDINDIYNRFIKVLPILILILNSHAIVFFEKMFQAFGVWIESAEKVSVSG